MSLRDSDSKRRHSKFDRESSPKRYRRDGKQERERERERERDRDRDRDRGREREREGNRGKEREREGDRVAVNGGDHVDRDQRNHLPHHSKQVNKDTADKKSNDHYEASKHSSDPTQAPRPHSYYQHDERGSAGQAGRSSGHRKAGGNMFTQSSEQNERVETGQSRELQDEKSHAKLDDNFQRRDGFRERKDDPPPTVRKRPAFREKKIPVDSGDLNPAAAPAVKSSHTDRPPERNERKEERSNNPHHLDRPGKQDADDRVANKSEARRDGFSSRVRYGGNGGNGNYRGRDKFHARQGYHPIKTRTEKWKHDLYQEVNKDHIPKSEDEQIAKLEALLAS